MLVPRAAESQMSAECPPVISDPTFFAVRSHKMKWLGQQGGDSSVAGFVKWPLTLKSRKLQTKTTAGRNGSLLGTGQAREDLRKTL